MKSPIMFILSFLFCLIMTALMLPLLIVAWPIGYAKIITSAMDQICQDVWGDE